LNIDLGNALKIGLVVFAIGGWAWAANRTHEDHQGRIERIEKATDAQQEENRIKRDVRQRNNKLLDWCASQNIPLVHCPLEEVP